ncbi:MAG: hypothetical protein LBB50_03830 [Oscillospiraceae bacterium]|jgi:hypothetical protein|nr:hypothetical protein [Oscillospiraceae bacterium]
MGLVYDLFINRECEDCVYGELDILENKYWCTLHEEFRSAQDREHCPDKKQ